LLKNEIGFTASGSNGSKPSLLCGISYTRVKTGWLGISLGDVTGIGPEVVLKALAILAREESPRFLLLGDLPLLRRLDAQLKLDLPLQSFRSYDVSGRFFVHNPFPEELSPRLPAGASQAARAAMAWLEDGAQRCLRGEVDALVTAPLNKAAVIRAGIPLTGQTEFLSQLAGCHRTAMMLLGPDDRDRWLRVALATTHVPLRLVSSQLSQTRIQQTIELTIEACHRLRLPRARIGVCGLNPHAGESGELGLEDQELIAPVVGALRARACNVEGPLAADALFYQALRGDYDAVVAMYHDQGLGPLKMVAFDRGVNWTLGLPFIRTSPDHGTAYDLAGQGKANASSMLAAIQLALSLAEPKSGDSF
jgi:4-hydroxythreonine-4-phosphate dehydrogenase